MGCKMLPESLQYTQLYTEGICPGNFQNPKLEVPTIYGTVMAQPTGWSIQNQGVCEIQLSTNHAICYGTTAFPILFENSCYGRIINCRQQYCWAHFKKLKLCVIYIYQRPNATEPGDTQQW